MKKVFCILGMAAGIWIAIIGFVFSYEAKYYHDYNDDPRDVQFGADFYTEQYAATRDVAINTNQAGFVLEELCRYFGFAIGGFGIVVFCFFGYKLFNKNNSVQVENNNSKKDELPDL